MIGSAPTVLLRDAARRLAGIGAGNPRLESEYLLAAALGCARIDLFRRDPRAPVPEEARAAFEALLARRFAREPLQYVLGRAPFCELELELGRGALIPRGETEVLVDLVTAEARRLPPTVPKVLADIGTGSGAILLALLHRLPDWYGVGIDPEPAALNWASRNRLGAGLAQRAELTRGDLTNCLRPGRLGIVVSNPPYIRTGEIPDLAPEIREHEPRSALDGGEDGLEVVRRLLPGAAEALASGGLLAVELAPDQPPVVAALLEREGPFRQVRVFRDLADRPRGILARRT